MESIVVQGRQLTAGDIEAIRSLVREHPHWSRRRISEELALRWQWYNPAGQLKDMAVRALLNKLEGRGHIELPARRRKPFNRMAPRPTQFLLHDQEPIEGTLKDVGPIQVQEVSNQPDKKELFEFFLAQYHFLGFTGTVGLNLRYLATDRYNRPLACLLFGSAAWKSAPRDSFIGWSASKRREAINRITNNTRFLVLPWVKLRHLATHLLGRVSRRIRGDFRSKYGYEPFLLESFVDRNRFRGTCYQAANWIYLGSTQGRTRNDPRNTIQAPTKDIYLYPLVEDFRDRLQR